MGVWRSAVMAGAGSACAFTAAMTRGASQPCDMVWGSHAKAEMLRDGMRKLSVRVHHSPCPAHST